MSLILGLALCLGLPDPGGAIQAPILSSLNSGVIAAAATAEANKKGRRVYSQGRGGAAGDGGKINLRCVELREQHHRGDQGAVTQTSEGFVKTHQTTRQRGPGL